MWSTYNLLSYLSHSLWVQIRSINITSAFFHFFYFIIIIICLPLFSFCHSRLTFSLFHSSHLPFPPIMLTIRYLQLWNPLHQCQSGQPHRWVQRCPLQEVPGSDRLSRGGHCAWGGAPEHHSMTYNPDASFTSVPVAVYALNCQHQGLVETLTGLTKCPPETRTWTFPHICYRLQRNSSFPAAYFTFMWLQTKQTKKKHQNAIVDELLPLKRKDWEIP